MTNELATLRVDELPISRDEMATGEGCFLCGKPMGKGANPWHVHVAANGSLLVNVGLGDLDPAEDMGWFPIGPECARHVPLDFRKRLPA